VRVLRDNLTRMRTTDKLDPHVEAAFTALSNDPFKWWFPSAESRWRQAHGNLETFYQNLVAGKTNFYPRADNLVELLNQYLSLMGGSTRGSSMPPATSRSPCPWKGRRRVIQVPRAPSNRHTLVQGR